MKKQIDKLPELSEHSTQQLCINYLKVKGFYTMRLNSGKYSVGEGRNKRFIMGQEAGTPDILAFRKAYQSGGVAKGVAKLYFFEVKRPKGRLTFYQGQMMKELQEKGAQCYVVHSLEELQEII